VTNLLPGGTVLMKNVMTIVNRLGGDGVVGVDHPAASIDPPVAAFMRSNGFVVTPPPTSVMASSGSVCLARLLHLCLRPVPMDLR
jgi:hypothetical protein